MLINNQKLEKACQFCFQHPHFYVIHVASTQYTHHPYTRQDFTHVTTPKINTRKNNTSYDYKSCNRRTFYAVLTSYKRRTRSSRQPSEPYTGLRNVYVYLHELLECAFRSYALECTVISLDMNRCVGLCSVRAIRLSQARFSRPYIYIKRLRYLQRHQQLRLSTLLGVTSSVYR